MTLPEQVLEKMMSLDAFSQWLGLEIDSITEGGCCLHFTIRPEMLNGHQTVHGGIIFSAADSAFVKVIDTSNATLIRPCELQAKAKAESAAEKIMPP